MDNSFKKQNFSLWLKIAVYASNNERIHAIKGDRDYMSKRIKKLHSFYSDGYLLREKSFWSNESRLFTPTQKFKDEFKAKFKLVSEKVRPDFTDKIRNDMLNSFKF